MDILPVVRDTIGRYDLIKKGGTVLVACSGGADSVALLHILIELKQALSIKDIQVAHLNHLVRDESQQDADFVGDLCSKLEISCTIEARDIPKHAEENSLSIEEAARRVRYEFLEEKRNRLNLDLIATGHTLNDQIETLFLRIDRGSGLKGLSLIHPKRNKIIRPLIRTYRKDILTYLGSRSIEYKLDRTNLDISIKRNLIRHKVVPYLLDALPGFGQKLMRMRDILQADEEIIDSRIEDIWKEVCDTE